MNRPVALKVLLPQAATIETVAERFTREAQLAKNLVHPNTIQLFDFGKTEGECLFIAMEYLDGETLDKLLKREGRLPLDRTIHIASQMLKSLAEAHEHGIVHRDLKPANIFLRQLVGEKDFVKVLDFGIAKALNLDGVEEEKLTQTGSSFGTPSYMAPEQIRGLNLGPHTDLYAVALIMLKMLTGKTAIEGGTPIETAALQLSPDDVVIPDELMATPVGPILRRALYKRIEMRYPNALEMLEDLQRAAIARTEQWGAVTGRHHHTGLTPPSGQMVHSGLLNSLHLSGPISLAQPQQPKKNTATLVLLVLIALVMAGGIVFAIIFFTLRTPLETGQQQPPSATASPTQTNHGDATTDEPLKSPDDTIAQEPSPPEPDPPPEDPIVDIRLESTPAGALVTDGDILLGTTPFVVQLAPEAGIRRLTITAPDGFKDTTIEIDPSQSTPQHITLEPVEVIAVSPPPDTKPRDTKPRDTKPKETKPAETKPSGSRIPMPDEKPSSAPTRSIPIPE